jgi:putative transcriptional regulator
MSDSIQHHLNDALLLSYSAGTLPEGFNLVVATHISLCDECRARMQSFDAVGGALLSEDAGAEMSDDSLAATLALIAKSDATPEAPSIPRTSGIFPTPLQSYVGGDLEAVNWRRVGGGVSQCILKTSGAATVRLLRIPGGTAIPDHGHQGLELTLVLQGAFSDDEDRFGTGDIEVANEDLQHTPVAEPGPVCICLDATDAPLRFTGLLPRLAQPFLKI